jgi:ATP-dependent DNA helicase RecG
MSEQQLDLQFASPDALTVEEIWATATAELLIRLREDRRIERKPIGIHGRELAEYFSMWANTVDGGLVVVGMEDDGQISGCASAGTYHNKLESQARDNCPDARIDVRTVPAVNSAGEPDSLLLIRVRYDERRVVKTTSDNAFIRSGSSKRRLKPAEIHQLEADKGQVDIEQEPCPHAHFPDDFDIDLVEQFVQTARERCNYRSMLSTVEILELRRLGRRKGGTFTPNVACVLLFAKDPVRWFPGSRIRFLRFEGEAERTGADWNAVKDIMMEGPIPILIDMAESALHQQLREFSRLGDDGKFYTAPEYPKGAWLEAVVNACVHRSYGALKNMNIFIRMFDDRLEIESPGGFPPPVTPENIYEMHHPRNPILMDAMMFLNFVKMAREGTCRMRDTMADSELPPPHFAQKDSTYALVRVTLRNSIKQRKVWIDADAASIIGADVAKTLTPQETRAVNFITENGKGHASEISRLLEIDWQTARKLLQRLVAKGVLRHVHRSDILRDPKAHFVVVPHTPST